MNTPAPTPQPFLPPRIFAQPKPVRSVFALSYQMRAALRFTTATLRNINGASLLTRRSRRFARALFMSAALLALSACSVFRPQPDPVRYFTLGEPVGEPSGDSVFRLAPISLAGHLRNRALAIRVGEHEIIYDESVRWTEPLDEMITLALHAQLASRSRTRLNAAPPPPPPRLVGLRVNRFELVRGSAGERGGRVELTAEWSLDGLPRAAFQAPPREWDGRDVSELVSLMREALDELALSCAAELQGALE